MTSDAPGPLAEPENALFRREWLVCNGLGGYAAGTVGGAPTRRYHGYLIAALPNPAGRPIHVELFVADGSHINTWHYLVKQSFWRQASDRVLGRSPTIDRRHSCRSRAVRSSGTRSTVMRKFALMPGLSRGSTWSRASSVLKFLGNGHPAEKSVEASGLMRVMWALN